MKTYRMLLPRLMTLVMLVSLLVLAGCQSRPGASAPAGAGAPSARGGTSSQMDDAPEQDDASGEGEADITDEETSSLPQVDAEAVATALIEGDNILPLLFHYNGNFDSTKEINASQMYYAVYKWYETQPDFPSSQKLDYEGYGQLDKKKTDALIKRWFGPAELPEIIPEEDALGEAVSGVLVNYDSQRKTYYFLQTELPMEEKPVLKKASVDSKGELTVKIDALSTENDEYIRTYILKLMPMPNEEGRYYLSGLNKGKQS